MNSVDCTIEKIVHGGAGLARGPRGVVLVPGTLPQERVAVRTGEAKNGVTHGELAELLTPSPRRIAPNCPLFLDCGGCDFLHTPYSNELDLKQQILAETIQRVGKLKPPLLPPVPAPAPENYRMFIQLKINEKGRIGLFRRGGLVVVPFEGGGFQGCRLQKDRLNQAVAKLQGKLAGYEVIKFRLGDEGFVVNLTSSGPKEPDVEIIRLIREMGATALLVNDLPVFGSPSVIYIYGEAAGKNYRFQVSHDAFFQSDPSVVQRITNRLAEIMDEEIGANRITVNLLDLYAGVGTFGIQLASKVLGVYAVEIAHAAAADLEFNMSENRVTNLVAYRSTAKSFLKRFRGIAGICLVDPPRAGLEADVRKEILRLGPQLLLYVSCDPATLARDLADFAAGGRYDVRSVQIFDQFGRTHHIESIAVLKKNC